jgi:hypothetical protein
MSSSIEETDGASEREWAAAEAAEEAEDAAAIAELEKRVAVLKKELARPLVRSCDHDDMARVRAKIAGDGADDEELLAQMRDLTVAAEADEAVVMERQSKEDELAELEEELALFARHKEIEVQVDALNDELDAVRGKGKKPEAKRRALEAQIEALEAELEEMESAMLGDEEDEGEEEEMSAVDEEEEGSAAGGGSSSAEAGAAAAPPVPVAVDPAQRRKEVKAMKPRDVKKALKDLGLSTQGQKSELVERLLEAGET